MIKNQWYAILPSKLVKTKKLIAIKRLNLNLVLFRTSKNEISCVMDICTHRGAALSKGIIRNDCVKCPFHGIEFDNSGKCKFIPANGLSSIEDLSRFNVESYLVKELYGIIFFWHGDKEKATDNIPFFNDFINDTDVYSEISDNWNTHYSRAIENQLDVVHVPFVHSDSIGRGFKTLVNGPLSEFSGEILKISPYNEFDTGQSPKKQSELTPRTDVYLNFIYPNLWLNLISDKVKVFIYFAPIDEESTILYIRFYTRISRVKFINYIVAFLGKYANLYIERQDKKIVITQTPKASSYKSEENLISGDLPIIMYRKKRDELKKIIK